MHQCAIPVCKTLLYNGAQFKDQYIQSYIGGRNGQPLDGASPTSYYLYKHIQEETSFVAGNETYFSMYIRFSAMPRSF